MYALTVTIGRNYGQSARPELRGTPMSDQVWSEFEDRVNELLVNCTDSGSVEMHHGTGVWDGMREESTKVTLLIENPLNVNEGYIRVNLEDLARTYGQDAIALTIGQSELITL